MNVSMNPGSYVTLSFCRPILVFSDEDILRLSACRDLVLNATFASQWADMRIARQNGLLTWCIRLPMSKAIPTELLATAEITDEEIHETVDTNMHYGLLGRSQLQAAHKVLNDPFGFPLEELASLYQGDFRLWISCGGLPFYYRDFVHVRITTDRQAIAQKLSDWLQLKHCPYNPALAVNLPTISFSNVEIGYLFRPPFVCNRLGYRYWDVAQTKDVVYFLQQNLGQMMRNVGVFGSPGSGKTQTVRQILKNVDTQLTTCLIVDVKSEYHDFGQRGFEVIRVGQHLRHLKQLRVNPFLPAPDTRLDVHLDALAELIAFSLFGGGGALVSSYLYLLLKEFFGYILSKEPREGLLARIEGSRYVTNLYQIDGRQLRKRFPEELLKTLTPTRLIAFWQTHKDHFAEKIFQQGKGRGKEDVLDVLSARINALETSFFQYFDYTQVLGVESLEARKIVLQLRGASSSEIKGLMSLIGLLFVNHQLTKPDTGGQLTTLLVMEEAHVIAEKSNNSNGEFRSGSQVIGEALARGLSELRSRGVGFLMIEQSPSRLLPEVLANTATQIIHNLQYTTDQQTMGLSAGIEPERLNTLSIGQAYVKLAGENVFMQQIRIESN